MLYNLIAIQLQYTITDHSTAAGTQELMIQTILSLSLNSCVDGSIVHVYSNVLHNQSTTIYSDEALHHHVTINTMMISP